MMFPAAYRAARSKYSAVKFTVDAITFDSKREATRYGELKLLEKAGHVRALRLQPRYALCALVIDQADVRNLNTGTTSPRRTPVAEYIADFEYEECPSGGDSVTWHVVVEDVKGMRTTVYKLKKRWFEAQYQITIREI